MAFRTSPYDTDYGIKSGRVDRFNGEPSWIEQALREYEMGLLGPRHACIDNCGCVACRRLQWLDNLECQCILGNWRWRSLSLEEAMRQKFLRCRCQPHVESYLPEESCQCLLLLTTQRDSISADGSDGYVSSPYGDIATFLGFMDSGGESSDRLDRPLTEREIQIINDMAQKIRAKHEAMGGTFPIEEPPVVESDEVVDTASSKKRGRSESPPICPHKRG
ncbi:hypothetical protein KC19_6G192000 [Ceratodon purpureus]|uniref:Uncharacterized protein n=1 Tax=Ceratodon purpureus TaxID=3225 RepID=A0A8T0HJ81_CERPU|nr:hypothetical protein KC19_6G192000 [Ceratodon purpureus]